MYCQDTMKSLRSIEKEISIKAPWGRIAALSWGSPSQPPVLLCHGKLDACSSFRPLVSLLPRNFYYVSLDLPGNGRSDHLPKGVQYSIADLVPTLVNTVKHFKWKKFIYIGHSLGVPIGKVFNMAYPGYVTQTVELDPVPAHHTWPTAPKDCARAAKRVAHTKCIGRWKKGGSYRKGIHDWYHHYYEYYNDKTYSKLNGSEDTAPKYTYEKAQTLLMNSRGISKESTDIVLERCLEPAGDGLYSYDQRMKNVAVLPFSGELLHKLYTAVETPTLCILAKTMLDLGLYENVPFLTDPGLWPNGNYRYKIVEGGHDTHIDNPHLMAEDISNFIKEDSKAKL